MKLLTYIFAFSVLLACSVGWTGTATIEANVSTYGQLRSDLPTTSAAGTTMSYDSGANVYKHVQLEFLLRVGNAADKIPANNYITNIVLDFDGMYCYSAGSSFGVRHIQLACESPCADYTTMTVSSQTWNKYNSTSDWTDKSVANTAHVSDCGSELDSSGTFSYGYVAADFELDVLPAMYDYYQMTTDQAICFLLYAKVDGDVLQFDEDEVRLLVTYSEGTPTPSNTPTETYTQTPTNTPLNTSTPTPTRTNTTAPTATNTPLNTSTPTPTRTFTTVPTATGTPTNTSVFTSTNTPAPTNTPTVTNTVSPTMTAYPVLGADTEGYPFHPHQGYLNLFRVDTISAYDGDGVSIKDDGGNAGIKIPEGGGVQVPSFTTAGLVRNAVTTGILSGGGDADISDDTNLSVESGGPLTLTGDQLDASYNATNLKITSLALNTIQDIATNSSPTFEGLNTNTITALDTDGIVLRDNDGTTLGIAIEDAGDVGIGVADPDGTLHVHTATAGAISAPAAADDLTVENSGDAGITILGPAANNQTLMFGNAGDNDEAGLQYTPGSDLLKIKVGGAVDELQISPALVSVDDKLYVNADNTNSDSIFYGDAGGYNLFMDASHERVGIGTNAPDCSLHSETSAATKRTIAVENSEGSGTVGTDGGDLILDASDDVYTLMDLGVGAADPGYRLVVTNNQNALSEARFLNSTSGTGGRFNVQVDGGDGQIFMQAVDSGNTAVTGWAGMGVLSSADSMIIGPYVAGKSLYFQAGTIGTKRLQINTDGKFIFANDTDIVITPDGTANSLQFGSSEDPDAGVVIECDDGDISTVGSVTLDDMFSIAQNTIATSGSSQDIDTTGKSSIRFTGDGTTVQLEDPDEVGHVLIIVYTGTAAGVVLDDDADNHDGAGGAGSGDLTLSADWSPNVDDTIMLLGSSGSDWVEISRSAN